MQLDLYRLNTAFDMQKGAKKKFPFNIWQNPLRKCSAIKSPLYHTSFALTEGCLIDRLYAFHFGAKTTLLRPKYTSWSENSQQRHAQSQFSAVYDWAIWHTTNHRHHLESIAIGINASRQARTDWTLLLRGVAKSLALSDKQRRKSPSCKLNWPITSQ